ncbi:unnamed protein product [Lactuca saligna]|uniref:DUF4371 domain-containing protein n=1 Tax=Lactuca saligna TaxID=75948 RepID=A0AA35VMY9_LACSI|nr:unnamed protein product [Lactuca saligna]
MCLKPLGLRYPSCILARSHGFYPINKTAITLEDLGLFHYRRGDDNGEGTSKRNKHNVTSQVPQPYEPSQKPEVPQEPQPNEPTQRFLLKNTLPFRGHDESENSKNRGLFIKILSLIREDNERIFNVTLENAPKNEKLTSPTIKKGIANCFSKEIIKSICDEIDKDVFGILIDESNDVSKKEQTTIVLRYVDRPRIVKERFIGVVHVLDTFSLTLKVAINYVFTGNNLSMAQVRGKVMMEQLQLVVVAVAKKHDDVEEFFKQLTLVVTVVCGSCKRKDMIWEIKNVRVKAEIAIGETENWKRTESRDFSCLSWRYQMGFTLSNTCKLDEFVC